MDDSTLQKIDTLENEARELQASLDHANGKLHQLQSMMREAGFPDRIKFGEDLHGNEDWVRVRPESQLRDVLDALKRARIKVGELALRTPEAIAAAKKHINAA